jgi:hypothetical protein
MGLYTAFDLHANSSYGDELPHTILPSLANFVDYVVIL